MASFITRIELHAAAYSDYETLHAEMSREGFSRTITSDQGITYHLPTAQYEFVGNVSRSAVLEKAKQAATRTRKAFGAIVTESAGSTWHNLPKA